MEVCKFSNGTRTELFFSQFSCGFFLLFVFTWYNITETNGGHGYETEVKSFDEPPRLPKREHPRPNRVVEGKEDDCRHRCHGVAGESARSVVIVVIRVLGPILVNNLVFPVSGVGAGSRGTSRLPPLAVRLLYFDQERLVFPPQRRDQRCADLADVSDDRQGEGDTNDGKQDAKHPPRHGFRRNVSISLKPNNSRITFAPKNLIF